METDVKTIFSRIRFFFSFVYKENGFYLILRETSPFDIKFRVVDDNSLAVPRNELPVRKLYNNLIVR